MTQLRFKMLLWQLWKNELVSCKRGSLPEGSCPIGGCIRLVDEFEVHFNCSVMQNMGSTHVSAYWVLSISVSLEPHTVPGEYWELKFS